MQYISLLHLLSDIPMFYIKYLTMYKVHMHAGAIRQLLYGCAYVRETILKLVDYRGPPRGGGVPVPLFL